MWSQCRSSLRCCPPPRLPESTQSVLAQNPQFEQTRRRQATLSEEKGFRERKEKLATLASVKTGETRTRACGDQCFSRVLTIAAVPCMLCSLPAAWRRCVTRPSSRKKEKVKRTCSAWKKSHKRARSERDGASCFGWHTSSRVRVLAAHRQFIPHMHCGHIWIDGAATPTCSPTHLPDQMTGFVEQGVTHGT